jgi:hypothetical protein
LLFITYLVVHILIANESDEITVLNSDASKLVVNQNTCVHFLNSLNN